MAAYMLDTDISSYIMKRSNDVVLKRLQMVAVSDVCVSAITKAELLYGVEVSPRRQKDQAALDEFLRYFGVLDFPATAALDYARIRAELKRRGNMIGSNDLLIAAHARCIGLTLVTNNTKEFGRVQGLKIENWTEPVN
jgi:tRNA(fMet)-specific endonuclease VapC